MFGLLQTHSADCVFIDAGSNAGTAARPVADAMVTGTANHAISILTADCVPVLLAAPSLSWWAQRMQDGAVLLVALLQPCRDDK